MIDTILLDLDGTLLPMELEEFAQAYFQALGAKIAQLGYDATLGMEGILAGTKAMIHNDGAKSNEALFWETFVGVTHWDYETVYEDFMAFYESDYDALSAKCAKSETMIEAVHILHEKSYALYLCTNPLFPAIATQKRIRWSGLDPLLFDAITTYENSHYAKPNIDYYQEVLQTHELSAAHCMMVGNDSQEDGAIEALGIPLYLVTDHLIHREDGPLTSRWHSDAKGFLAFVKALPSIG